MKLKIKKLIEITKKLSKDCEIAKKGIIRDNQNIDFAYNPLKYAWKSHKMYLEKYGNLGADTIIMGMNPGHGMGNTGIPFGCPEKVKDYLKIKNLKIREPKNSHPKRIITGLECNKPEISGRRIWSLIEEIFGSPEEAFKQIFVLNHFPLWLFNKSGQNITPDKLKSSSAKEIFDICNGYLLEVSNILKVKRVIAVGKYASRMAKKAIEDSNHKSFVIDEIPHPSPANPLANKQKGAIWRKIAREIITSK